MYKIICEHKLEIVNPALTKFMGERCTPVRPGRLRKSYRNTEEVQEKVVGGGAGRQEEENNQSSILEVTFPVSHLMIAFLEALHFRKWPVGFPHFYLTIFPELKQVSKWGEKILIHTFNTHLLTVGNRAREIVVDQGTVPVFNSS